MAMKTIYKYLLFHAIGLGIFANPGYSEMDCKSVYNWKDLQNFEGLKGAVNQLIDNYHKHEELITVEKCIQQEAEQLNEDWVNEHFNLVASLNTVKEQSAELEKRLSEIKQLERTIEIQDQAIQSIKLVYQSKLLEIPTAYLLVASKKRGSKVSQQQLGRQLNRDSMSFLEANFADHHIKRETVVRNYRIVQDFIKDFQGGRVQSFEFDPITFLDPERVLHYIQVYRLYPLFPTGESSGKFTPKGLLEENEKSADYIKQVVSADDSHLPRQVRERFQDVLGRMLNKVVQTNQSSGELLYNINEDYYHKVSVKEKLRSEHNYQLRNLRRQLKDLPGKSELQKRQKSLQSKLNKHINSRDIIVVTNTSELHQTTNTILQQYTRIVKEAYNSLTTRAKTLRSFKFYRAENYQLIEADAGEFYGGVTPVQYAMPFFRNTYRDEEGGLERLGVVLGLRVKLSHTGFTDFTNSTNSLGMKFVYIKPGTFMMGSPESEEGRDDETQHKVTLTKGFYMQTPEVTHAQCQAVMGNHPSDFKNCGDNCPVENISWNDAQEFIEKLNRKEKGAQYRLPTEAEWEYACRAGTETRFYTGDSEEDLDRAGWYDENSDEKTHPVGRKEPNGFGLYDMHGNVWEWCQDWYGEYPTKSVIDPKGPSSGPYRVLRGGSWFRFGRVVRSARRSRNAPSERNRYLGLRLARGQQVGR
jgi:formylglycine-generating enzyme required for sulfatase activity